MLPALVSAKFIVEPRPFKPLQWKQFYPVKQITDRLNPRQGNSPAPLSPRVEDFSYTLVKSDSPSIKLV